jgi:hypothetical protein
VTEGLLVFRDRVYVKWWGCEKNDSASIILLKLSTYVGRNGKISRVGKSVNLVLARRVVGVRLRIMRGRRLRYRPWSGVGICVVIVGSKRVRMLYDGSGSRCRVLIIRLLLLIKGCLWCG